MDYVELELVSDAEASAWGGFAAPRRSLNGAAAAQGADPPSNAAGARESAKRALELGLALSAGARGGDAERDWMDVASTMDTDAELQDMMAAAGPEGDEEEGDDDEPTALETSQGEAAPPSSTARRWASWSRRRCRRRASNGGPASPTRMLYGRALGVQPSDHQRKACAEVYGDWGRCVLDLQRACDGHALAMVGADLIEAHGLRTTFGLDAAKMGRFLARVEGDYGNDNPYHNSVHGADVLVATHLFLAKFDVLPHLAPIMLLAGFLAAIVHDFNHPGTNNAFEVKVASPLAVRHSDDSVLERHHLAAAFEILYRKEYDVLEALDGDERKQLRGAMIDVVLATDLRGNFDFIKKLEKIPRKGPEPDAPWPLPRDAKDDPKLALTVAVKFADIGHALKPFDQHEKWSMLVTEEFYKIGDREKALGVPVSFLCDRDKDTNMAKSQIGYFKFVCNPFYKAVAELVDAKLGPFDNLESNLWQWFLLYKGEALPTAAPGKKSAKRTRRASAAILRPHIAANGAAAPAVAANGGAPDLLAASGRAPTPRRHSSVLSKKEVDSSLAGGKKLRVANEI
ncbi:calmodulin-dependent cyclic-nucleotide phosphodiesterase [Aureococcus anophagefferens]|nr:calmodulin-dependent cyclic-nucleotide phosphodiesterase [Aureococcus anophagefferens]